MLKPISQRGFEVRIGSCSYSIGNDGREIITITKDKDNRVVIWYGEEVESVMLRNNQCDRTVILRLGMPNQLGYTPRILMQKLFDSKQKLFI